MTKKDYVCAEIKANLILQIFLGVMKVELSKEALCVWNTGFQGYEELFRLARSMTPTFSTIINWNPRKNPQIEFSVIDGMLRQHRVLTRSKAVKGSAKKRGKKRSKCSHMIRSIFWSYKLRWRQNNYLNYLMKFARKLSFANFAKLKSREIHSSLISTYRFIDICLLHVFYINYGEICANNLF